jgi:hypothetical protein
LRGFGPLAQAELACALEAKGFVPAAHLSRSEFNDVVEAISKLQGKMESGFQNWKLEIAKCLYGCSPRASVAIDL